ncbi:MAG: L-histidine N(alpha)-methyltransferase [Bryobacteraceae bacterium]
MAPVEVLASAFARDVRDGLGRAGQKRLSPRYFYDAVGSALFEAITRLDEYGLTRADERLLRRHARDIAGHAGQPCAVAELGSGTGRKTRWLLEALAPVVYYPIDLSEAALADCERDLSRLPAVRVVPMARSYADGLGEIPRAAGERLLVLFLGSTIGNFDPPGREWLFRQVRALLSPGDAFLVGADLQQSEEALQLAYDDPAGVTAAFNLNLLARINRELGANFDLARFRHAARYDARERRVEMHLRSLADQRVAIPAAGIEIALREGETIWTESSYKFAAGDLAALAAACRFDCAAQWIDAQWPFCEMLLVAR